MQLIVVVLVLAREIMAMHPWIWMPWVPYTAENSQTAAVAAGLMIRAPHALCVGRKAIMLEIAGTIPAVVVPIPLNTNQTPTNPTLITLRHAVGEVLIAHGDVEVVEGAPIAGEAFTMLTTMSTSMCHQLK